MAAKAVQISIDADLLHRIDSDAEAKRVGRSAFIRMALSTYLRAKERREVDETIRRAYEGKADELLADVEALMRAQTWPKK
jgi:metal-responsive CopG/Arc/MetJ family transcriptional regulator